MRFQNREEAGKALAPLIKQYTEDVVIIGLARGGIVVAVSLADALGVPFDITCPRKIGAPYNPEFAIGAITEQGTPFLDEEHVLLTNASEEYLLSTIKKEQATAKERMEMYRKYKKAIDLTGKTVILTDDGLATGATMQAAIRSTEEKHPRRIIVAVPVAPKDTVEKLSPLVDKIYCVSTPPDFYAVGQFYEDFGQVYDEEILLLLQEKQSTTE